MIIDAISDLHGFYPELEGGDLLIVAGDLTEQDKSIFYQEFFQWIGKQNYKKKVVIAGNHDGYLAGDGVPYLMCELINSSCTYLIDSGTEFEGLNIWGSPWTRTFEGQNPKAKAFALDTEEELAKKWSTIPNDVDILVTHSPPYPILDQVYDRKTKKKIHVGSISLGMRISQIANQKKRIHICGHVHEGYGTMKISDPRYDICNWTVYNASYVTEAYEPINKPIRIVL